MPRIKSAPIGHSFFSFPKLFFCFPTCGELFFCSPKPFFSPKHSFFVSLSLRGLASPGKKRVQGTETNSVWSGNHSGKIKKVFGHQHIGGKKEFSVASNRKVGETKKELRGKKRSAPRPSGARNKTNEERLSPTVYKPAGRR